MVTEIDAALVLSGIFFIGVFSVLRVKLFTGRYGRRHRLTGFVYLCWCACEPPERRQPCASQFCLHAVANDARQRRAAACDSPHADSP